jgi:hypothetical protein
MGLSSNCAYQRTVVVTSIQPHKLTAARCDDSSKSRKCNTGARHSTAAAHQAVVPWSDLHLAIREADTAEHNEKQEASPSQQRIAAREARTVAASGHT